MPGKNKKDKSEYHHMLYFELKFIINPNKYNTYRFELQVIFPFEEG